MTVTEISVLKSTYSCHANEEVHVCDCQPTVLLLNSEATKLEMFFILITVFIIV